MTYKMDLCPVNKQSFYFRYFNQLWVSNFSTFNDWINFLYNIVFFYETWKKLFYQKDYLIKSCIL